MQREESNVKRIFSDEGGEGMELEKVQSATDGKIFDVAAAVAERIKELEESHEEFMRRDAELNRMIDEAWKKGGSGKV